MSLEVITFRTQELVETDYHPAEHPLLEEAEEVNNCTDNAEGEKRDDNGEKDI